MARREVVVTLDDLTGDPGANTYRFSWDGVDYEIDLVDVHYKDLNEILAPYVDSARKVRRNGKPDGRSRTVPVDSARIREWAQLHDYDVSDRGRIPYSIVDDYHRAHSG